MVSDVFTGDFDKHRLVLGYLSPDVPIELILAAGASPLRLKGDWSGETPLADEYIKPGFNPVARAVFNRLLDGTYSFVDRVIFSNLDESNLRLFYLTREIKRQGLSTVIPDIYCFEFLHTQSSYNLDRLRDFRRHLEEWTGAPISDEALRDAIALVNDNRRLRKQVAALRTESPPRLAGSAALRELLSKADDLTPREGTARIYLEGSSLDDPAFYEMVEACNVTIVGENSDWGARYYDTLTEADGDPLEAICRRYMCTPPHPSKSTVQQRVDYCLRQVEAARADAVIFVMLEGDHPPHWDYPEQQRALHARGIPTLCLPWQRIDMARDDAVRAQVATFTESIAVGAVS